MKIFNIFRKKVLSPHVCKFECNGYCSHFSQVSEIERAVVNPTWYHYPSPATMMDWIRQGNYYASVYQSHWQCSCGKSHTFFFLAHPKGRELGKPPGAISQTVYNEMTAFNPIDRQSSPGLTIGEITKSLTDEFCPLG